MTHNRKWLFAAIASVGLIAGPAAHAEDLVTAQFSYVEDELASEAGVKAVYKRLRMSAKRACEPTTSLHRVFRPQCQRDMEDRLVKKLESKVIIALHKDQSRIARLAKAD